MSTQSLFGALSNLKTGDTIRPATREELHASREAALVDGGVGGFEGPEGVPCFVEGIDPDDDSVTAGPYPFRGPVGQIRNRAAHGCSSWTDTRIADGATRQRNQNGAHEEVGPWSMA